MDSVELIDKKNQLKIQAEAIIGNAEKESRKQDDDENRPTVEKQLGDENSLLNEVKKLIKIRQSAPALQSRGKIEFVYAEKNTYPLAYMRSSENDKKNN